MYNYVYKRSGANFLIQETIIKFIRGKELHPVNGPISNRLECLEKVSILLSVCNY